MSIETELKLRIKPADLAKLQRHALLKTGQIGRSVTRRLHNIYFDTPALALHRAHMALRLRRSGGQWLQTLKGGGAIQAGLHQRNEWEVPVPQAQLDFSAVDAAVWDAHLPIELRKQLQPVFVTDFLRTTRLLAWRGAQIEVCLDRGEVRAGQHSRAICELELELKTGEPQQLFELALAILEVVPFQLEVVNKAELGFQLLTGQQPQPSRAQTVAIKKHTELSELLQTHVWSCLLHLQQNLRGMLQHERAEYLHQVRIALRRLRVVLRLAQQLKDDDVLQSLRMQLARLGNILGKVREWEVFIATTLHPLSERMPQHSGLQALLAHSVQQCDASYAGLQSDAFGREMQRVMLRVAIWMKGEYWLAVNACAPDRKAYAKKSLNKLARCLLKAKHLTQLNAEQLHGLRKLAKRLRYSMEFLLKPKRCIAYFRELSNVQEVLGKINDVAVAHRLLEELAAQKIDPHALDLAQGWMARDLRQHYTQLPKNRRKLRKQSTPW